MAQFYFKRKSSETPVINIGEGIDAIPVPVKCTVIGDSAVGKTSLLTSYMTGVFNIDYVPTIYDSYQNVAIADGVAIDLELCDTAGEEDLKRFRSFSYFETDIFIICFSIVSPKTLKSVINRWIPEIKEHWTNKPFILVGTKYDLRNNIEICKELSLNKEKPIGRHYGHKLASKYGAINYIECSAATKQGVDQVFEGSIKRALDIYSGKSLRQNCITCTIM